jgi:hypothetical protein
MASRNSAGKSFDNGDIAKKYGAKSAAAGQFGEKQFAELLAKHGITRDYDVWYSLRLPSDPTNRNATKYNSDVDVAVAAGNKLLLIDVKRWAGGYHYWSIFGRPFKGVTPIMKNGKWILGSNMAGALSRYRKNLPGITVEAIVIFVPTNARGSAPSSVFALRWPGGIKSYLHGSGLARVKSFLGKPQKTNSKIESLLSRMAR